MMKRDLTDISEELTSAIMQGDGATALDLFAEYAERADEVMVELARDLRHMTEERDTISSAWDELAAERDTLRAQLDAAGWRPIHDTPPMGEVVQVRGRGQYVSSAWDVYLDEWRPAPPQE